MFVFTEIRLRLLFFFFFQAEDGIRDWSVTGVQTCALPIFPGYRADVGVTSGRIARIGRTLRDRGRDEIDARGAVVAPGFIDGHTHMDAQVAWDPLGTCSCWHGVTTVVM